VREPLQPEAKPNFSGFFLHRDGILNGAARLSAHSLQEIYSVARLHAIVIAAKI
jgi:hypothetical protein